MAASPKEVTKTLVQETPITQILVEAKFPDLTTFRVPEDYPQYYREGNTYITASGVRKFAYIRKMLEIISEGLIKELYKPTRDKDQATQLKTDQVFIVKLIKAIDKMAQDPSTGHDAMKAVFNIDSGIVPLGSWQQFYILKTLIEQLDGVDAEDFTATTAAAAFAATLLSGGKTVVELFQSTVKAMKTSINFLDVSASLMGFRERVANLMQSLGQLQDELNNSEAIEVDCLGRFKAMLTELQNYPILFTSQASIEELFLGKGLVGLSDKTVNSELDTNINFRDGLGAALKGLAEIAKAADEKFSGTTFKDAFVTVFEEKARETQKQFKKVVTALQQALNNNIIAYENSKIGVGIFSKSLADPNKLALLKRFEAKVLNIVNEAETSTPTTRLTALYKAVIVAYVEHARLIADTQLPGRTGDYIDDFMNGLNDATRQLAYNIAEFPQMVNIIASVAIKEVKLSP